MKKSKVLSILVAMLFCFGVVSPVFAEVETTGSTGNIPYSNLGATEMQTPAQSAEKIKIEKSIDSLKKKVDKKIKSTNKKIRKAEKKVKINKYKNIKKQNYKIKNLKNKIKKAKGNKKKNLQKQLNKAKIELQKTKEKKVNSKITNLKKQINKSKGNKKKNSQKQLKKWKKVSNLYTKLYDLKKLKNNLKSKNLDKKTLDKLSKDYQKFENSDNVEYAINKLNDIYNLGDVKLTQKDKDLIEKMKKELTEASKKNDTKKIENLKAEAQVFYEFGRKAVDSMKNLSESNKYGKYLSEKDISKVLCNNNYLERNSLNKILEDFSLFDLMEFHQGASGLNGMEVTLAGDLLTVAEKNGYNRY